MSKEVFSNISYQTSSYKMNQDLSLNNNPIEKQCMVSIQSSDFNYSHEIKPTHDNSIPNFSIRRTFSADMSSPKWLKNNGFPLKKVKSSHDLQELSEDNYYENNNDHDQNKGLAFEDIWSSIQADKRSWGNILSTTDNGHKSESDRGQLPPPYVHPLARRSTSSLSEKSLEICTESLGSETGSDGFSNSSSNPEELDKEHHEYEDEEEEEEEEEKVKKFEEQVVSIKCNYSNNTYSKRSMMVPSSFPPPLPSMANRKDGSSNLQIRRSHREDGHLVMEAFSVRSQNCFRAQRTNGRLLLTLNPSGEQEQDKVDCEEEEFDITKEVIKVKNPSPPLTMMSKLTINKPIWPRSYNTTVIKTLNSKNNQQINEEEIKVTLSHALLPRQPRVSTTTTALNAYEYYWRKGNSTTAPTVTVYNPFEEQQNKNIYVDAPQMGKDSKKNNKELLFAAHDTKKMALAQQNVVLVKTSRTRGATSKEGNEEYLVPFMLRGCKDHKRSFFLLDPYCIAT